MSMEGNMVWVLSLKHIMSGGRTTLVYKELLGALEEIEKIGNYGVFEEDIPKRGLRKDCVYIINLTKSEVLSNQEAQVRHK